MKGLVLAGGRGTRLQPFTHTRAKQLVPIGNKANLDYAIEDLVAAGVTDIGVVVSPETGEAVRRHLGAGERYGARFTFIPQDRPGGIAHAVKIARDYLAEEPFVLYLGDNLLDGGIRHILERHAADGSDACILLTRVSDPSSFGVAVLDEAGRVVRLVEKPREYVSDLALVGVYLFTPAVHPVIADLRPSGRGELEITEAIQGLVDAGRRVDAEEVRGWWKDTGRPEDLLDANRLVLSRLERNLAGTVEDSEIVGEVVVAPGAVVRRSRLRGPVSIAAGAVVEDSYVGPYTSVGENARVVHSEVEYSILMGGARLENLGQRLDSSILGEEACLTGSPGRRNTVQFLLGDRSTVRL